MKSRILTIAAAVLCLTGQTKAANLFWDPGLAGQGGGSGDWTSPFNLWANGSLAGARQPWADGNDATFDRVSGSSIGPVALQSTNVSAVNLTVVSGKSATIVAVDSGELTVTGTVTLDGNLSLHQGTDLGATTTRYHFTGSGTVGAGSLTLNKTNTTAGSNLLVALGGVNTTIGPAGTALNVSSAQSGLIGIYSNSTTGALSRNVSSAGSNATTYLGATAGNTLAVSSTVTGGTNNTVQIGSQSLSQTGTVSLNNGASIGSNGSTIDLNAGTLLINGPDVINDQTGLSVTGESRVLLANGVNETLGALTMTTNSVIDFGNNALSTTIHFGASDLALWAGNTLSLWNYTPGIDHLVFDSLAGTINRQTFYGNIPTTGQIHFYSDSGTTLLADMGGLPPAGTVQVNSGGYQTVAGEVVPVPEPTAMLSLGLLLLAAGWKERHLFARVRAPKPLEPAIA